jgi:hypothetical protein
MYDPLATFPTTKEPDNMPPEIEQSESPAAVPDSEHVESLKEKTEPDTRTVVPEPAEEGFNKIVGCVRETCFDVQIAVSFAIIL